MSFEDLEPIWEEDFEMQLTWKWRKGVMFGWVCGFLSAIFMAGCYYILWLCTKI